MSLSRHFLFFKGLVFWCLAGFIFWFGPQYFDLALSLQYLLIFILLMLGGLRLYEWSKISGNRSDKIEDKHID